MISDQRFGVLRTVLRALGLSTESTDDIVNWIIDLLAAEESGNDAIPENSPYHLRDNFLTPAEQDFFEALRVAVGNRAVIYAKVGLGDIFRVKKDDPSRYRIYTNQLSRKRVDFLLCNSVTMHPLVGIKLDDKNDQQTGDSFMDQLFEAAHLALIHIPSKSMYDPEEIVSQLTPYVNGIAQSITHAASNKVTKPIASFAETGDVPRCPTCGSEMVLRIAKGNQFWSCSNYPTCRSMLPYES
jgi:hypothetical protein